MPGHLSSPFTQQERALIRLELMPRFGQEPDLANGLFLRTWRDGPQKSQPKIPKDPSRVRIPVIVNGQSGFFRAFGAAGWNRAQSAPYEAATL